MMNIKLYDDFDLYRFLIRWEKNGVYIGISREKKTSIFTNHIHILS
jgi:hypothetical protein